MNIYPNNLRSIHHLKLRSNSPTPASQLRNAKYIKPFLIQYHPRQIPDNRKRARLDVGALRARLPTGVSCGDTLRNHCELHKRAPKKERKMSSKMNTAKRSNDGRASTHAKKHPASDEYHLRNRVRLFRQSTIFPLEHLQLDRDVPRGVFESFQQV
jgi:hypothetical protein